MIEPSHETEVLVLLTACRKLTRHLGMIDQCCCTCRCDADPSALANYVVALVKKDKPEKELKALCADQLDVFLQKGT